MKSSADPVISIAIPTFNSAWSVADSLASVMAQDFRDLEVLVINDGSTDNLAEVVAPFLAADTRIRKIDQQNLGLAGARNRGLAEARGEFVAFLDADDIWHPAFLSRCLAALRQDRRAPFAYAYSHRIDAENRLIPSMSWPAVPRHDLIGLIEVNSVANGSASLFRRADLAAIGGFDDTMRDIGAQGAEDWKVILELAAKGTPAIVAHELVAYRVSGRSMSRSNPDVQLRAINQVLDQVARAHPDVPRRHIRNARTTMNGWMLDAFLGSGRRGKALALLAQSYILNPLWFLSRDLRMIHRRKLWSLGADRKPRLPLSDLVEDGVRPFAFLAR